MVKKKSVKKSPKKAKKNVKGGAVRFTKRKFNLVWKNLVLFGVLALVFFCLYVFSNNQLLRNLF